MKKMLVIVVMVVLVFAITTANAMESSVLWDTIKEHGVSVKWSIAFDMDDHNYEYVMTYSEDYQDYVVYIACFYEGKLVYAVWALQSEDIRDLDEMAKQKFIINGLVEMGAKIY